MIGCSLGPVVRGALARVWPALETSRRNVAAIPLLRSWKPMEVMIAERVAANVLWKGLAISAVPVGADRAEATDLPAWQRPSRSLHENHDTSSRGSFSWMSMVGS